jgi:hypothetical protein
MIFIRNQKLKTLLQSWLQRVQVALQDEHGGHLIHHLAPAPATHIRLNQHTLSRRGGEAFVPKNDLNPQSLTQSTGELHDASGCIPKASIHVAGQTHHDFLYLIFPSYLKEMSQVSFRIWADPYFQTLGGYSQGIAHGQSDPFLAHIQGKDSSGFAFGK